MSIDSSVDTRESNEIDSESAEDRDSSFDRIKNSFLSDVDTFYGLSSKYEDANQPTLLSRNIQFQINHNTVNVGRLNEKVDGLPEYSRLPKIQNRFISTKRLHGYIVSKNDDGTFISVLEDESGVKFTYEFEIAALPEPQRARAQIGHPVLLLIGKQYEGTTLVNKAKIYLALFSASAKKNIAMEILEEDKEAWSF